MRPLRYVGTPVGARVPERWTRRSTRETGQLTPGITQLRTPANHASPFM